MWVGNFSGAPMRDVSGVTGAAPIWRDVVQWLHASDVSAAPAAPNGVARQAVAFDPPVENARGEWFLRGTEMDLVRAGIDANGGTAGADAGTNTPRIRYPAAGTVIAVDPDIPEAAQRVVFKAAPAAEGLRFRLDGVDVPRGSRQGHADWSPASGRHVLTLEDSSGRMLSSVAFEVRGNPASVREASDAPRGDTGPGAAAAGD